MRLARPDWPIHVPRAAAHVGTRDGSEEGVEGVPVPGVQCQVVRVKILDLKHSNLKLSAPDTHTIVCNKSVYCFKIVIHGAVVIFVHPVLLTVGIGSVGGLRQLLVSTCHAADIMTFAAPIPWLELRSSDGH